MNGVVPVWTGLDVQSSHCVDGAAQRRLFAHATCSGVDERTPEKHPKQYVDADGLLVFSFVIVLYTSKICFHNRLQENAGEADTPMRMSRKAVICTNSPNQTQIPELLPASIPDQCLLLMGSA